MLSRNTQAASTYHCHTPTGNTLPHTYLLADNVVRSTVFGESFDKLGEHVPAKPEDYAFTKSFWQITQGLLATGELKPHPIRLGEEGLVGVFEGMQQSRLGKVSGEKLVYRVDDTEWPE